VNVTYTDALEVPSHMYEKTWALQAALLEMPQFEPPTEHIFHGGMYCRKVSIPAGCTLVGKVHKQEHFFAVASGTVCVTTDDGAQLLSGFTLLTSYPGTKRAIHAVSDSVFMTFHATDATDVEQAEQALVEEDAASPFALGNKLKPSELEVSS
jgi:quercetin dioxygenase-like cupin family protein